MPIIPAAGPEAVTSEPELLTSDERWRRWEQRGRESDVRFMRRARRLLWFALAVLVALYVLLR